MIGTNYYRPSELVRFLKTYAVTPEFCRQLFKELNSPGRQTLKAESADLFPSGNPISLYNFIRGCCWSLTADKTLPLVGCKENYREEFIPYLLDRGAKVLQILRDPRDMITSLNYGSGPRYGGQPKPLLFDIRQWRKSAAFGLAHEADPNFLMIRYEDLVRNLNLSMERVVTFLGISEYPPRRLEGDLKTQTGSVWMSNSSHFQGPRITTQSVGRYREHLTPETDFFVQSTCFSEMKRLGYKVQIDAQQVEPIMEAYEDTRPVERAELASYRWSDARREEEKTRWRRIQRRVFEPSDFIFEKAFLKLLSQRD